MKRTFTAVLSVLLAITLAACSGGEGVTTSKEATVKTTDSPATTTILPTTTISPSTEPTIPALPSFEELYPTVGGKDNLFDMTRAVGDANAETAATDGKLLIFSTVIYGSEENMFDTDRTIYALDLASGEIKASIKFNYDLCEIFFLDDGNIMISAEPAHVRIVDRELNTIASYDVSAFTDVMSVDPRGYVWETSSGKYLMVKRNIKTDETEYFSIQGYEYGYYMASIDGVSYFRMLDADFSPHIISLDEASGKIVELSALNEMYGNQGMGGIVSKDSAGKWMTASLAAPSVALRFSTEFDNEYASCASGDRFAAVGHTDGDYMSGSIVVYNIKNGDRLCVLDAHGIGCESLDGISIDKDGNMLLVAWTGGENLSDERASICLWRTASEPLYRACEDAVNIELDNSALPDASMATIADVKDRYGVEIKYSEVDLIGAFFDYELYPMASTISLTEGIDVVASVIGEFPVGFFDEVCEGGGFDRLVIYLCSGFRPLDTNGIESAVALTGTSGDSIIMALDITSSYVIRQNFAHETMHAMEHRIGQYLSGKGESMFDRWDLLNPRGFDYYYSYHDSEGNEVSDTKYTTWDQSSTAFFVDPYSKSSPSEDRARVFEYLFTNGRDYFESPYLEEKADCLISIIKESFPSVAASDNVVWER